MNSHEHAEDVTTKVKQTHRCCVQSYIWLSLVWTTGGTAPREGVDSWLVIAACSN